TPRPPEGWRPVRRRLRQDHAQLDQGRAHHRLPDRPQAARGRPGRDRPHHPPRLHGRRRCGLTAESARGGIRADPQAARAAVLVPAYRLRCAVAGRWPSKPAVLWALYDAGDVPAHLLSTLLVYAVHAGTDGRGAHPSAATVATLTRKTERIAKYNIAQLV